MVGKQWSPGEEKFFWKKIVPRSPKRLGIHRLNPEDSWDHLAEIMQRSMGNDARRKYTGLSLSPEEKASLERRQDDRARRPRTTKAKRDRAALAVTKARERAEVMRRKELEAKMGNANQGGSSSLRQQASTDAMSQDQPIIDTHVAINTDGNGGDGDMQTNDLSSPGGSLQRLQVYRLQQLSAQIPIQKDQETGVQEVSGEDAISTSEGTHQEKDLVQDTEHFTCVGCIDAPGCKDEVQSQNEPTNTAMALETIDRVGSSIIDVESKNSAAEIDLLTYDFGLAADDICLDSAKFIHGIDAHDNQGNDELIVGEEARVCNRGVGDLFSSGNSDVFEVQDQISPRECVPQKLEDDSNEELLDPAYSSSDSNSSLIEDSSSPSSNRASSSSNTCEAYQDSNAFCTKILVGDEENSNTKSSAAAIMLDQQHLGLLAGSTHDALQIAVAQATQMIGNHQHQDVYSYPSYTDNENNLASTSANPLSYTDFSAVSLDSMPFNLPLSPMDLHALHGLGLDMPLDEILRDLDMAGMSFNFNSPQHALDGLEATHMHNLPNGHAHGQAAPMALMAPSDTSNDDDHSSHSHTCNNGKAPESQGGFRNGFEMGLPVAAHSQIAHMQQVQEIQAQAHAQLQAMASMSWGEGVLYFDQSMI
ncbi:Phosphatidylglycerophosphatase GEP4 mitochondrial [Ceratocystis lukuohia]|uniref:Phosphatidylglycerophosphatase GEP4 mitochondrial n=1 Tax=Ceratocystis lukuohia TaxID=2019550 RepID=A0ABR4MHU0_9PEZI